jgi:predicted transcriptional regulator
VSSMERFYDVLFELSNEDRHRILLRLDEEPSNLTNLARELELSFPETSRHVLRLSEVGLIQKDVKGSYRLTPYGEVVLKQLHELEFTSKHKDYFINHTLTDLPIEYIKRLGDLKGSKYTDDTMRFFHRIENLIKEAEEYVWFQIDEYPISALEEIEEAIGRGVQFRIIEPKDRVTGPHLSFDTSDNDSDITRTRYTPLAEHRTLEKSDVFLFLSDKGGLLAFPAFDGRCDYRGFTITDEQSLKWCGDIFTYYWEIAESMVYISPTEFVRPTRKRAQEVQTGVQIIVEGRDDSPIDARSIQDAVDNYDEVVLRGTFNFLTSNVIVRRSVVIRGDGREDDIPSTKIHKRGWDFPFSEWDYVFCVDGEGVDVTIENIHFTDFNCIAIGGMQGNSLTIKENRITLETGIGRGMTFGHFGDTIIGVCCRGKFPGSIVIEGNYLDFALSHVKGGFIPLRGLEEDPNYRPDLVKHENYIGIGIFVQFASGKVLIDNNIVRNMNARGIMSIDCSASAEVLIKRNTVFSRVYGVYMSYRDRAGYGILTQTAWQSPSPGYYVDISDNIVNCEKINFCGINIAGPHFPPEGADKLCGGFIKNNAIYLENGLDGILVQKCDDFEISDNKLSGRAYYGIQINARPQPADVDLGSYGNIVENNDMTELEIKSPDEYSDSHVDGDYFSGSPGKSSTVHVWLAHNSRNNTVKVRTDETVIDEGIDNTIIYEGDKHLAQESA